MKYEYDAANRLRTVKKDDVNQTEVQTFQYGSSNARLMALDHSTNQWTIYAAEGGSVMAEYTEFTANTPTWTKSYTYLGGSQLSTITPNGTGGEHTEYNHPDRLGTRTITAQTGGISYEQAHLPFGTALNAESTTANNKRFTSYDRSPKTGLDYAVNRTYDSKLGRFSQVDPIGIGDASLVNPQSFNLYSYCHNDPVNYVDPSGLGFFSFLKKLFKWVMIAVAVVVAVALVIVGAAFVAGVVFNATLPAFLGGSGFLGALSGAMGSAGSAFSFMAGAVGVEIGASAAVKIGLALLYGIGAISNYAQKRNDGKKKKAESNKSVCPPTGASLANSAYVLSQLYKTLLKAEANMHRNEEGGWIYMDKNGTIKVVQKNRSVDWDAGDGPTTIVLSTPRNIRGYKIVATFHTHAHGLENPSDDTPTIKGDLSINSDQKVPGIILSRKSANAPMQAKVYGPDRGIFGVGIPKECK